MKTTNTSIKITKLGPRFERGMSKINIKQECCPLDRDIHGVKDINRK
jgi:hypothetical protein